MGGIRHRVTSRLSRSWCQFQRRGSFICFATAEEHGWFGHPWLHDNTEEWNEPLERTARRSPYQEQVIVAKKGEPCTVRRACDGDESLSVIILATSLLFLMNGQQSTMLCQRDSCLGSAKTIRCISGGCFEKNHVINS